MLQQPGPVPLVGEVDQVQVHGQRPRDELGVSGVNDLGDAARSGGVRAELVQAVRHVAPPRLAEHLPPERACSGSRS